MGYPNYEAGFFFSDVSPTGLLNQYSCYAVHSTNQYPQGLCYPGRALGEVHMIVQARNRAAAERKIRKKFRKYHRKNIL